MFRSKWPVRGMTLLLRRSGSGIEIFGVRTVEVPSVIPARRSATPPYLERARATSLDRGPVKETIPNRANCEQMYTNESLVRGCLPHGLGRKYHRRAEGGS